MKRGVKVFKTKSIIIKRLLKKGQISAQWYRAVFVPNSREQTGKYWPIGFHCKVSSIKWGIPNNHPNSNWSLLNKILTRSFFPPLFLIISFSSTSKSIQTRRWWASCAPAQIQSVTLSFWQTPSHFSWVIWFALLSAYTLAFPCHPSTCFEFMKQHPIYHTSSVRWAEITVTFKIYH